MGQVCPIPSERPDRRLIAAEELARVNWLGITSLQKAIVIDKQSSATRTTRLPPITHL